MALTRDTSQAQLAFQVTGLDLDLFQVLRYRGTEGLCQLYRFEIELASSAGALDFATMIGQPAVLSIHAEHGQRWFHGIIGRCELTGETHGAADARIYYRVELMPAVWMLTHRYNSRIFQGRTVPEIIADVLSKAGIAADRVQTDGLQRSYTPREYCVQYRETDYNFICRLMEEEGIRWYFEQLPDGHTLILEDGDCSKYARITGEVVLPYVPPSGMNSSAEHVYRFRVGQSVRPGAVALTDFNFKNPQLTLASASDAGRDQGLEFFDYPGGFHEQKPGTDLARIRMEEFEAHRTVGSGQSNSHRLAPGKVFELSEHPTGLDGQYLITQVTHVGEQAVQRTSTGANGRTGIVDGRLHQSLIAARQNENESVRELAEALLQIIDRLGIGDQTAHRSLTEWLYHAGQVVRDQPTAAAASGGRPLESLALPNLLSDVARLNVVDYDAPVYDCRFECIPAAVTYRPPRVSPWPVMRGTQTARVVGPEGEEIHTDEYGRVRVQFNWDREGWEAGKPKRFGSESSCWIRVSQGMAGGAYGMMFLPRVGQEVVVDFLEGNPNDPIIVGRVYNADHMPPYKLPDEKTKSVIKTHSSLAGGGNNEIRFEDLKDKEQLFIQAQRQMDLRVKANEFHTVGASYHLTVGGEKGDLAGDYRQLVHENKQVHVLGELRTHVELDESRQIDGKVSAKITGTCTREISGDVIDKYGGNHKHDVTQTFATTAANIKLEATAGIEFKCGGSSIVLTPQAIFIVGGPIVNVNSGSGPPVAPVTAGPTSPELAEDPGMADASEPGKDVRYDGAGKVPEGKLNLDLAGHTFEPEEVEEKEPSWIEIELRDEDDMPVPGERYEILAPDGKTIRRGSLDANGLAHVWLAEPGNCQITFPNLDAQAWERS